MCNGLPLNLKEVTTYLLLEALRKPLKTTLNFSLIETSSGVAIETLMFNTDDLFEESIENFTLSTRNSSSSASFDLHKRASADGTGDLTSNANKLRGQNEDSSNQFLVERKGCPAHKM